jgi:hypothetical protein
MFALRQEGARTGQRLDQVAAEVSAVSRSQIEHGAALAGLAGTVSALDAKADRLERRLDAQADVLASVAGTVAGHGDALAGLGMTQQQHGAELAALGATQREHGEVLAAHTGVLATLAGKLDEVLRRLPAGE